MASDLMGLPGLDRPQLLVSSCVPVRNARNRRINRSTDDGYIAGDRNWFQLGLLALQADHGLMLGELERTRSQVFWAVFKIWGGIMAFPGLFFLPRIGLHYQYILFEMVAPGIAFGAIGAASMTLLVRPGQKLRALVVGLLVGFGTPAAFFSGLAILLPKNEATMGYVLFGMIFAMTGAFAGIVAANSLKSE
jgi:hypothetical protein